MTWHSYDGQLESEISPGHSGNHEICIECGLFHVSFLRSSFLSCSRHKSNRRRKSRLCRDPWRMLDFSVHSLALRAFYSFLLSHLSVSLAFQPMWTPKKRKSTLRWNTIVKFRKVAHMGTGYMSRHRAVQCKQFESIWCTLNIFDFRSLKRLVGIRCDFLVSCIKGFMYLSCRCHNWSVPQRLHLTVSGIGMPRLLAELAVSRSCFCKPHTGFFAQSLSYTFPLTCLDSKVVWRCLIFWHTYTQFINSSYTISCMFINLLILHDFA